MLGTGLLLAVPSLALLALGVRLWRRGEPGGAERVLGLAFAVFGCGLVPRMLATKIATEGVTPLVLALNLVAHASMAGFAIGLAMFARQVFRPRSDGGLLLQATMIVAIVGTTAALLLPGTGSSETSPLALAVGFSRSGPETWVFVECVLYASRMARQRKLGLVDPLVANRFVLWAVWTGALAGVSFVVLAVRVRASWLLAQGADAEALLGASVRFAGTMAAVGLAVAAVGLFLSFQPPASYVRWVRRHSA